MKNKKGMMTLSSLLIFGVFEPTLLANTVKAASPQISVKQIQQKLNQLGYKDVKGRALVEDGILGNNTKYVIKLFQKTNALVIDGIVGPKTRAALFDSMSLDKNLSSGQTVSRTSKEIQQRLNDLGYFGANGSALVVDGKIGINSIFAIKAFQIQNGLIESGSSDASTISLLFSENAKPRVINIVRSAEDIQNRLNALGYVGANNEALVVDGKIGTNSIFAIKAFQAQNGLEETGIADSKTIATLFSDSAKQRVVEVIEVVRSVEDIQSRLNDLGYVGQNGSTLKVDGKIGTNSTFAIKAFQKANDLQETGAPDEKTVQLLFSDNAKRNSVATNAPSTATSYQTLDIHSASNVTAEEINNYIASYERINNKTSLLSGQGQMLIDVATSAGLNQVIFAAMAIHESGCGTNNLAKFKNNFFSVAAYDVAPFDCAYSFESARQAMEYQARFLLNNYTEQGAMYFNGAYLGDKSGGLNVRYASDANWGAKIAGIANKIHPFSFDEYGSNTSIMAGSKPTVSLPDTFTDYSVLGNITGVAVKNISLQSQRGGATVATLPAGARFTALGKYNNQTMKILYDDRQYYFLVPISRYKESFYIENLMSNKVTGEYAQGVALPAEYRGVFR